MYKCFNKGREVPCLELGDGDTTIILTSRRHACESTGTYVLQCIVEQWNRNDQAVYKVITLNGLALP